MSVTDPRAQAAITAITDLDTDFSSAQQNLQTASDLHKQDQATISANQAMIADLKQQLQQGNQTDTAIVAALGLLGFPTNPLTAIETLPKWKHATDHDVKVRPHGTFDWNIATDGWLDSVIHPAGDWDNYYHYYDGMGPQPNAVDFFWYGEFMLPTQVDYNACQAFEIEIEQCINGNTYDTCAWQFPLGGGKPFSKFLRFFDKFSHSWNDSPIPFDPGIMAPGKVVTLLAESSKLGGTKTRYDAVTVNGQKYPLSNITVTMETGSYPATVNFLHFSWQQDPIKSASYRTRVRNMIAGWR